ncbi:MAG TPA: SLBB domain-containing protein [Pirellulales bacterium]|nr:SLBB domain-containing protein [Pirellulales bacterium]
MRILLVYQVAMFYQRALVLRSRFARAACGGGRRSTGRILIVLALSSIVPALSGCRTAHYSAKRLPQELRVAAAPADTGINLERMGGAGVGTSQIGTGDLVEITIVSGNGDERVMPVPARVAADGTVLVPLIGAVPIGGVEPIAAEQRIAHAAIERGIYRQPYVTLEVIEPAVNRVTVLGAVGKPGVVELPRGACDLASALAAAGGLSKEAGTQIEILHHQGSPFLAGSPAGPAGSEGQPIRLAAHTDAFGAPPIGLPPSPPQMSRIDLAQAGPAAHENRQLEDRDVVMVLPEEKRIIHVTGLVRKPDQFAVPQSEDIHVLDAIAMAGGTTSPVADKVYVIRQMAEMPEPVVIKVSIAGAKRNGNENLRLASGDLVSVESTVSTLMLESVSKFFRMAIGVNGRLTAL